MWNFAAFTPFGVALAILSWLTIGTNRSLSVRQIALRVVLLWLLSWSVTVCWLIAVAGNSPYRFVFQRDFGYILGSLTFTFAPFLVVIFVVQMLRSTTIRLSFKLILSLCAAGIAWLFTPGLFAMGWITGCAITGYSSCL